MTESRNHAPATDGRTGSSGGGKPAAAFARDERGVIVVMFALLLPVMVGFIGIGVELGYWFMQHRDLQAAADAAALSGSYEVAEGRPSGVGTIAQREAENNGWVSTDGTITIRANQFNSTFPATGAFTADSNAVEVVLTRTVGLLFSGYFLDNPVTINARAVGTVQNGAADACVVALAAGNPGQAVKVAGSSTNVTLNGCSIAVNSTDNQALKNTSGTLTADCIYIEGSGGFVGSPNTTKCSGPKSGQKEVADPYASIPEPTAGPCDFTDFKQTSGTGTVTPGTYCGGIEVTGGTLNMDPGLYIMDEGNFKITGGADVSGANVNIILMDSTGGNSCGIFEISGGGSLNLTAEPTGTYGGILVYRHITCSSTQGDMKFVGGSASTVVGAIYAPSKEVKISGGTSVSGSCLQIVSDTVEISGNGTFGNDCDGTGVKEVLAGGKGVLVE